MRVLVAVLLYLVASSAWACLHFDKNFNGQLTEGRQEFFLYHDGKNAHMILRTHLHSDRFPKEVAWVLPLPVLPSKYEEVDGPFFQELSSLFPNQMLKIGDSKGRGGFGAASNKPMKVHERVDVGNYQIQPIEILQDNSTAELNSWLKKNGFIPMPDEKQKKYLKKGAVFLAIRMTMNHPVPGELISKPLHITYAADRLTVPLLFTHDTRTFDLNVFVFSKKEMKQDLSKMYLEKKASIAYKDEHMKPFLDAILRDQKGFITLYQAEGLNTEKKKLKDVKEDPVFLLTHLN